MFIFNFKKIKIFYGTQNSLRFVRRLFLFAETFDTAVFWSVAEHIVHQKYVKKLTNVNHKTRRNFII